MFRDEYRNVYDNIVPSEDCVDKIRERYTQRTRGAQVIRVLRPALTIFAILVLFTVTALPTMARTIPAVRQVIERYVPALSKFMIPDVISSISQGIVMQVEAIDVKEKTAEILVSFSDEEGYDYINGKVDLYGGYNLSSYGASSNIGGCSFLEYRPEEDKAYFKVDVTTWDSFDRSQLTFQVYQLLTECIEEERDISLDNIIRNPQVKQVSLNGRGGLASPGDFSQYFVGRDPDSMCFICEVLDLQELDANMKNSITVLGTAYTDGLLRVQVCRGNLEKADRHAQIFLVDEKGTEQHEDYSVDWRETVDGERLSFTEHWFWVDEEELDSLRMYGIFYITDHCVEGEWRVDFRLDSLE
ncbi:MAG: hypothetical protein K2K70_04710 [Lachnospiraceae bacterium]|nr:hypothetical protein [Lachnospiraceae bacterium]